MGTGTHYTWNFGLSSAAWMPHSTNRMDVNPTAGGGLQACTALSEKYRKVFVVDKARDNLGVYDPVANAHTAAKIDQSLAYADEGTACITEGHTAHLMVALGRARGSTECCLWVADLDDVMSVGWPNGSAKAWAIENSNSADSAGAGKAKLLSPPVAFRNDGYERGSLTWSKSRQKLILFQGPPAGGSTGTPAASTIHVITIPTGSTGGVPNWKTQPWIVTSPQLSLGPRTTGIHAGTTVGNGYKRFSWSEALDCAIWVGAPESDPVQAIRLW
jgi:hypothetical protein